MENRTPEQSPAQVIAWLRSPEGERWSRKEYIGFSGRIRGHGARVFLAEIIPDARGGLAEATWVPDGGDVIL